MNSTLLNSTQSQLLQQLRDVHAPETVSWWPLATGWWIIIGLVALIALLLLVRALLKKHHYRYVRFAVSELKVLQQNHEPRWLAKSHNIMRRVSLCYVDEAYIGSLSQSEWMAFLKKTGEQSFSQQTLDAFVDLPYKPDSAASQLDKSVIMQEIIHWAEHLPEQAKAYEQHREREHV